MAPSTLPPIVTDAARLLAAAAALALCAMICVGDAVAQATPARKLTARTLERQLARGGMVKIRHRLVTGPLRLQEGDSLDARDSKFTGPISVAASEFPRSRPVLANRTRLGALNFERVKFKGEVDLYLLKLASFNCDECDFAEDLNMHSVETDDLWLLRTAVRGFSVFAAAEIRYLNLADANFEKTADFGGARIGKFNAPRLRVSNPVLITWRQLGDDWAKTEDDWATAVSGDERASRVAQVEGELRFWKRNFTELDQPRDAREANFQLIKLKRSEEFKPLQIDWWLARVLEIGSRYGTRPYRVLIIATPVIVGLTVLFVIVGFRRKREDGGYDNLAFWRRLPYAFAFSLQTFVPFLTIPGIKDSGWKLANAWWLEPLAGVLGVVLFGLAAYSLTYLL